jgi:hypothetical protein
MSNCTIHPETLRQLISNCKKSSKRVLGFPRDWRPYQILNPNSKDFYFSDASAWEFIAECLESCHPHEVIELDIPKGALALTMKIILPGGGQPLYIKVQIGPNMAIGRSFHLSERY